jgi:ligand-binding SRPBCC domain-containing protein
MTTIQLETRIAAPAMRVFLLSLSIDLHMDSTAQTRERAIAGVTHGLIGSGESVTWRGRHFGVMLQHTSLITRCEPPFMFEDVMTKGMFASFNHRHTFEDDPGGTRMHDQLDFSAPLGALGLIAERIALKSYLERFLIERDTHIKRVAESDEWLRYIPASKQALCYEP